MPFALTKCLYWSVAWLEADGADFPFSNQAYGGVGLKCHMQKKNILRRRRLTTADRKRATSYYSEEEHRDIAAAAAREGVSLSSFIASAALKEARKTNSK